MRDGERIDLDAYDASELFERAGKDLRSGRCDSAMETYGRLISEFPRSSLVPLALYNRGLCLDDLGRHEEAVSSYRQLVQDHPDSDDLTDALFRMAGSLEALEAWDEAVTTLDRILEQQADLRGVERVEALARKGSAMMAAGREDDAWWVLEEAVRIQRTGRGISPSDSVFHYSMAQFKLGEILHHRMRAVALPSDESTLEQHLEQKAQYLLEAQRLYTKVIRIGDPHWAAAAAYRIGALYHHLWEDMLSAPPPNDLNEEEREIYLEVLRTKIRVLLRKAVIQWERTLKLASRLNLDNEWVDSTNRDLEEIRKTLVMERAEEMLEDEGD